jgi:hypothetical protein
MSTEEKNNSGSGPKENKVPTEIKIENILNYEPVIKGYQPNTIVDSLNPPPGTPTKPSAPTNNSGD